MPYSQQQEGAARPSRENRARSSLVTPPRPSNLSSSFMLYGVLLLVPE